MSEGTRLSKGSFKRIKKYLAGSSVLNRLAASILAAYIRLCHATTKWDMQGFEALNGHLDRGEPVIIVVWHERLFFSTYFFDTTKGHVCAITTNSRMATLGHLMLTKFDFSALMIPPKSQMMRFNRQILKHLKNRGSIVISPDGTRGPAREAKNFPILWARTAKVPVYMASFSVRRYFCLPTWDRSQIALPFNKGAMLIQRWESEAATARASASEVDDLCLELTKAMNDVTDATDARVGRR